MPTLQDLSGQRFGRLTVIERGRTKGGRNAWVCLCDCGARKVVAVVSLKRGASTSCGCFRKDQLRQRVTTHGGRIDRKQTPEYSSWCNMLTRTTNEKGDRYADYGGRGINVCERWRSFENFLADMGARPTPEHTIERKDNNLGYSPENCRWSTLTEQGRNKRNNLKVEYRGETKCLSEWSELMGIQYGTLYARIADAGMSAEIAFNKPVRRRTK